MGNLKSTRHNFPNKVEDLKFLKTNKQKCIEKITRKKGFNHNFKFRWDEHSRPEYVHVIHYVVSVGTQEALRHIVHLGADVNQRTDSGLTPIQFAVLFRNIEVLEELVEWGADTDEKEYGMGFTALHYACQNKDFIAAKKLLELSADTQVKDKDNKNPLDIAKDLNNRPLIKLLSVHDRKSLNSQHFATFRKQVNMSLGQLSQKIGELGLETTGVTPGGSFYGYNNIECSGRQASQLGPRSGSYASLTSLGTLQSLHESGIGTVDEENTHHQRSNQFLYPEAERIQENFEVLNFNLDHTTDLVNKLFAKKIITFRFKERLKQMYGSEKNEEILDYIMKSDSATFHAFVAALGETGQTKLAGLLGASVNNHNNNNTHPSNYNASSDLSYLTSNQWKLTGDSLQKGTHIQTDTAEANTVRNPGQTNLPGLAGTRSNDPEPPIFSSGSLNLSHSTNRCNLDGGPFRTGHQFGHTKQTRLFSESSVKSEPSKLEDSLNTSLINLEKYKLNSSFGPSYVSTEQSRLTQSFKSSHNNSHKQKLTGSLRRSQHNTPRKANLGQRQMNPLLVKTYDNSREPSNFSGSFNSSQLNFEPLTLNTSLRRRQDFASHVVGSLTKVKSTANNDNSDQSKFNSSFTSSNVNMGQSQPAVIFGTNDTKTEKPVPVGSLQQNEHRSPQTKDNNNNQSNLDVSFVNMGHDNKDASQLQKYYKSSQTYIDKSKSTQPFKDTSGLAEGRNYNGKSEKMETKNPQNTTELLPLDSDVVSTRNVSLKLNTQKLQGINNMDNVDLSQSNIEKFSGLTKDDVGALVSSRRPLCFCDSHTSADIITRHLTVDCEQKAAIHSVYV